MRSKSRSRSRGKRDSRSYERSRYRQKEKRHSSNSSRSTSGSIERKLPHHKEKRSGSHHRSRSSDRKREHALHRESSSSRDRQKRQQHGSPRRTYSNRRSSRSKDRHFDRKNNRSHIRDEKKNNDDRCDDDDRWPNDKFAEYNRRRDVSIRQRDKSNERGGRHGDRLGHESHKRHGLGYDKQTKRQFEQDIMDTRRTKREVIGREGTSVVWGSTPSPSER